MTTTTSIRDRLRQLGITPRKSLGQNFLTDDQTAQRIVRYAGIAPEDTIIEIGPGIGALTRHLVTQAAHVIAIEIDRSLIPVLEQELGQPANLAIVQADALEADFATLAGTSRAVRFVGNLPYYITSAVIRRMLETPLPVRAIVLTVQLEVAHRMTAQPDDMSLLAVSVQFYGQPELLARLSPSAFYPQPDVDSAVVRIIPHQQPLAANPATLFTLARAGFSQRRKQLRNTLAAGLHWSKAQADDLLAQAGINPARRAETLSMDDWVQLSKAYAQVVDGLDGNVKRSLSAESVSAKSGAEQAPNAANATEL
ncbi:MAG: 16S rRNA (adenine(1518)-N(6)/adenine(1519)-N(6))-dimethyltransferase RsmA [Chloroflexi bacterium]|nr:16S rRNA (adenine(1518)-N(6)/adenine(1519)-N(6))-dimethyltransferase RsmA [Chloroflexota bacterium]